MLKQPSGYYDFIVNNMTIIIVLLNNNNNNYNIIKIS